MTPKTKRIIGGSMVLVPAGAVFALMLYDVGWPASFYMIGGIVALFAFVFVAIKLMDAE